MRNDSRNHMPVFDLPDQRLNLMQTVHPLYFLGKWFLGRQLYVHTPTLTMFSNSQKQSSFYNSHKLSVGRGGYFTPDGVDCQQAGLSEYYWENGSGYWSENGVRLGDAQIGFGPILVHITTVYFCIRLRSPRIVCVSLFYRFVYCTQSQSLTLYDLTTTHFEEEHNYTNWFCIIKWYCTRSQSVLLFQT